MPFGGHGCSRSLVHFVHLHKISGAMVRKLVFISFIVLFAAACAEKDAQDNVTISGTLPGSAGQFVFLEELEPLQAVMIDSVRADERGRFRFSHYLGEAGFFVVRTTKENSLILLLEPGESVAISTPDSTFLPGAVITGSTGSMLIVEFEQFMALQRSRIDSLSFTYNEARGTAGFFDLKAQLDSLYLTYLADQKEYIHNFQEAHPTSLANLLVVNRKLGTATVLDEQDDFLLLYRIDSLLQIHYPGNKHAEDHHERVEELRGQLFDQYVTEEKLSAGKKAPDVVANDTLGEPVSLKSFTGKTVILYFWAGWDARSRVDNRRLVALYPGFQKKNIEILGVSLDEHEVVWKGAIRLDQLSWPQVCELKGIYSQLKKDYNIPDRLPYYYLIDEQQKIKFKHPELDSLLVRLK